MFFGSMPALVTPFAAGRVNEAAFRELVEWQIDEGSNALVPCGTTGEAATLTTEEHRRLIEITVEVARGRVPVLAGCGSNNTAHAIALTKIAKDAGADAALHVPPYYNRPNQDGIYAHLAAVAELEKLLPRSSAGIVVAGKLALYLAMALFAAGVAATLYRFGPSREDAQWQWLTPGSIFTAIIWLLLAIGFSFYVTRLTDYSATYGSIAAIVMLLTWMYLSAYIFLFGAELNAELEHQTAKDSTTGAPQPLGKRGAWVADHVAGAQDVGLSEKGPSLAEAGPPPPDDEAAASGRGE